MDQIGNWLFNDERFALSLNQPGKPIMGDSMAMLIPSSPDGQGGAAGAGAQHGTPKQPDQPPKG